MKLEIWTTEQLWERFEYLKDLLAIADDYAVEKSIIERMRQVSDEIGRRGN